MKRSERTGNGPGMPKKMPLTVFCIVGYMSIGLPMIAGLVPLGLTITNSITFLLIYLFCTLLVFAIKWYLLD